MPVISIENLSKAYHLGQIGTGTLSRDINVWWAKLRGKPDPMLKIGEKDHGNRDGETIWALKDVNFTVEQGEALGIIGRNGAGKSTLLKILSRVTAPTSGHARVKGRIASLLEVGTGFHPDLTGRENIYLNGAILGMTRQEIRRKLDEIVEFAEIEQFIDTPVKRYSSGMYVRLAFAVAAHLDPEILVVDEVLAVGDALFQKKCLGKMGDIAHQGRTILFVSHNLQSMQTLCQQGICLHEGDLVYSGTVSDAVNYYTNLSNEAELFESNLESISRREGEGILFRFTRAEVSFPDGQMIWSPLIFTLEFNCLAHSIEMSPSIEVWNAAGMCAFTSDGEDDGMILELNRNDFGAIRVSIAHPNLPPGRYIVRVVSRSGGRQIIDWVNNALIFDVYGSEGISARVSETHLGSRPHGRWSIQDLKVWQNKGLVKNE